MRNFLLLVSFTTLIALQGVCQNNADEEVIRSRIIEIELENPADTKLVKEILSDLSGDGTW
ncbi:MAG: hypothetical protein ACJAVP_003704, partial [Spirosomataceae bacterium]